MRYWKTVSSVGLAALLAFGAGCDSGSSKADKEKAKAEKKEEDKEKSSSEKEKSEKSAEQGELPYEATGTVATVDGAKITAEEYNDIVQKRHSGMRRRLPKQMAERMKTETLNALIDKHLIEREIEKADVEITDEDAKKEFANFKERFPNEKAFQQFLKFRKTSKDEIQKQIKKDLALRQLLRESQGIEVTDEAAKKYYDDNPKKFEQPEKVKARHILINTPPKADDKAIEKARKKAEKIAKEAQKEGADFAKLAKEKSEGPSAKKGGDLGYFSKNRMVPGFSEKAFAMKDGEISGPVKTKFGFHIIKREGHKEAKKKTFDEVKDDIVKQLERKEFRSALDKFLKDLKKDAKIEKNPDNIKVNVEAKKPGSGGGLKGLGNIGGGKGGNLQLKMNQLKGLNEKGGDDKESGGSEK